MKKSNKLLLSGFLTLLLFIAAIHITLFAKYKNGDFSAYNAEEDMRSETMQSFPNILFVSIQNLPYARVTFSDVAQVDKEQENDIQYVRKGDTLQISANPNKEGFNGPVSFSLPHTATLSVSNSSLTFEAGRKTLTISPTIYLQKSQVIFSGGRKPFPLGHLQVVATDNSLALFQGTTEVDHLELQLSHSAFESAQGNFGQLSITTDSASRISLPAKQLVKASIKTTAD